jgi:diphthamide biosynthesis protein 7
MASIKSTISRTISLPPSCMEFLPNSTEYFLIGTYFLQNPDEPVSSEPQERNGSLILMRYDSTGTSIQELASLPVPYGVLDLHFSPHSANHFATANSTGGVSLYTCKANDNGVLEKVEHVWTIPVSEDQTILVLALAWRPNDSSVMAVTLSDGNIVVLRRETGTFTGQDTEGISMSWSKAHSLEAWTLSFNAYALQDEKFYLYSGGDDSVLQKTICSSAVGEFELVSEWANRKIHGAGVTAILPIDKDTILTGSYDDHLRVIDLATGRPKEIVDLNQDGGVWRLKRLESEENQGNEIILLVSCMYAGCRLVKVMQNEGQYQIEVLAKFEEHKSMNYASEAFMTGNEITVISTSFYDKLVCLWKFKI